MTPQTAGYAGFLTDNKTRIRLPNLEPLVGEISWAKNLVIMSDPLPSPEEIAQRLSAWAGETETKD